MAGGNLGDLWFDLNIKDSNVRSKLKEISEALSELDLKTESGRKSAEKLFKNFNRENSKEIAEDFKNIAAQMGIQALETANLSKRLKELSELKADILRRDKEQSEHGNFVAMKNEAQAALDLTNRYNELAKLKEDILRRDKEMDAQGAFVTLVNESKQAQELNERYREMQQLKSAILERDRQSTEHGNFVAMKKEAQAAQELAVRERELAELRNAIVRRNEEMIAAENRLREATERTNQARREAISVSRKQAESLVRDRAKELEAQRQQIQGLYGSGKNVLSTQELMQLQQAFSQITKELNTLRSAMNNLGSYSIKDLFSIGRGTSEYTPLINSMRTVIDQKQEAINLERKHQEEITRTAAKARNDLAAAFAGANAEAKKMQSIVGDIKSLFLQGGIVFGAQQFFNSIVQTGGEIVQQHVALRSILGDVQKADELFAQTQQLALQSPFKFGELNRDVKQLAAFGVEANDLYDTTKRLADIASGLGVSFERLGLAYGQVKARSWLDGKELRQFAYAGLPLLQRITELYNSEGKNGRNNYTQADVKKMITARQVSFEDVQKVLWKMTDEGGQFYNMQFVLSETLLGRWNKLIDAWDIMLGKFAEGKNIVGGTFSFIINRVTDLVLALDKLSPALLSFGAVFAARKLGGMAYSKMGIGSLAKSYTQQMNAQLKSYAIEQQQLVVEGEITQKIAQQNVFKKAAILSEKQSLVASYNRSALEGRMSVLQMQRAVKEGLVSKEIISQLALMGQITAKQEQIILNGGRMSAVWSMTTSKIGGFVNAIGGWWGIGITTITSLLMGYNQWSSRVKEEEKTLIDGAKQKSKSYGDFLSGLGPKDASNLSSQVDSMKEILKSSDDYTDSIKQQVESAGSLSKQYDILKEKIEDAKKANDGLADKYGVITNNATSATGLVSDNLFDMIGADTPQWLQWLNGLTNDDIAKNVEQAQESLSKFQVMFDELDSSTKAKMEDFIRSLMENNEELANQIKGLPLTEQIRMLAAIGGDDWEKFVDKFANGSKETENWLKELAERAKDSSDDVSEIMYDDVPRGLESVRKQLGLSQDQFRTWAKRNPEIFASMMDKMAQKANITSKTILYYFHSAISKLMDMDFWPGDSGNGKQGKPSYNSGVNTPFSEIIRQRLHKNGTFTGNKKKGKFWTREVDNALRQVQDQSFETTGENIRKELKAARNELDTIVNGKVSKNSSEYKNAKHKYDLWKAIADAGYISDDLGKNKVTGNFGKDKNKNGRKEDKQLKNLRERIDLYKKMYAEIKKFKELYGEGALGQLANDGEFETIFGDKKRFPISDYTNYETSIKELLKTLPASTKDRLDYAANEKAGIQTENRKLLEDQRRDELNTLNKQLDVISEQYETYKKIYELTGNKKGSENIAFGGTVQFDTYKRFLEEQLDVAVKHDNVQSGLKLTTDEVKGMSLDNIKDRYGSESRVYDIRKKLDDETRKIKQETIDLLANLVEKNATIDQQIEDENRKYERQLELIKGIKDTGMRDRATEGAEKTHNENLAKLEFERFKQGSDWVTIFDDLDRVSSTTINSMVEKIDEFSKTTGLSVEVVKQLRDALGKLRDEQIDRNPINGIIGGMQRGNAIGSFIDSRFRKGMDISTTTYVGADDAKKMGIQKGNYTKGQLEGEQKGAYADANKGVAKLAEKFNALQDCLSPVINLFEVLGEEDSFLGQATNMASGAFGAAAQVSGGLNALGLGNLGPYGAAAGAALSVATSLFAMHDKALQKEIEASKERQKELDNMTKNIKSIIEDTLGGIYSYKVSDDTKNTLNKVTSDYERSVAWKNSKTGKNFPFLFNSIYSADTYKAAKEAQSKPDSAYHAELASLMAQRDELQSQRDSESEKKKKDNSKIADYNQQIKEMEQQINTFAQDFLKDIYSIDMKSWASELTDAVVGAWEKGEDAVEAYRGKVKDMVKDVTKNIVTQKIMESALQDPLNYLTGILKDKGKLDETDMDKLADKLYKAGDEVVPQITGIFEALKNRGWDFRDNGSSSSTKNSIQSITEETADIIASYLNSIRLYCAEDNTNLKQLTELTKSALPEISVIAKSQLNAMNQLVSLAEYRNDRLDDMYSWMRSVTKDTGSKSLRIS